MNTSTRILTRWAEACAAVGMHPEDVSFLFGFEDSYPHFKKKRGFAVCLYHKDGTIELLFAPKTRLQPVHRQEGLIRHELGHALDFLYGAALDPWAKSLGYKLPRTPERRADKIAEVVWGEPIRYDRDLVQSVLEGKTPRPWHLGL